MKIILHWIVLAIAVFVTPYFIDGIHVNTIVTALIVGAILYLINKIVKPIITILTLPLNIITLGLFSLVLNGLFFMFVASFVSGFTIDTFKAAFLGALVVSIINWLGTKLIPGDD